MKQLSCGILLLNPAGELLLCHVTGAWHWDIPKGGVEPGETPPETALRETREECGVDLAGAVLLDLGRMAYRPRKDLHLFATLVDRFGPSTCHCASHYRDPWGRHRPEMDGYEWTRFDRVARRCARHMSVLLGQTLSLRDLLLQLQAADPAAAPIAAAATGASLPCLTTPISPPATTP